MKRLALSLAAVALLSPLTVLQAQVKLEHKFPDGRKTTVNTYVRVEQTLTIGGMDIPTISEQNITTTTANGKRQADGKLESQHKITSLQSTLNVVGMELTFDSANPDAPAPGTQLDSLLDVFKAIAGSNWTMTYGEDNTVLSVKGSEAALEGLSDELKAAAEGQLDPENLVNQSNQELKVLPDEPVKQGDTWEREEVVVFDAYQSMTFKTVYKYEGTVEKGGKMLDKITSKTTEVTYKMKADSPSPLKIVDSDLKVEDSTGTILFDRAAGMFVDAMDKKHVVGSIKCDINGQELPGKLDLSFETTTNQS